MSDVCVVTGGGSGMGLSAALQMPKQSARRISVSRLSASMGISVL
jgi:NAD(P)-dependent dehydrogenase (short-subunit alcohol dehydrogenase family)